MTIDSSKQSHNPLKGI